MNARFYAPGSHDIGDVVELSSDESQHITRVLRLGVGALVRIFDGHGHEFDASIANIEKSTVRVAVGARRRAAPEPGVAVCLMQAVLKGDKMDDVVRDAVMLGVTAIQPLVTERTEILLASLERSRRRERWQRVAIASAKQCGRAVVPTIGHAELLGDRAFAVGEALTVMCVEPDQPTGGNSTSTLPQTPPQSIQLVVGPEGGWTQQEIARLSSTATLLTLGGRTLRADAMALVALTALFTHWHEL